MALLLTCLDLSLRVGHADGQRRRIYNEAEVLLPEVLDPFAEILVWKGLNKDEQSC